MTEVGTNTKRVMVIDDDEINNFLCSRVIMNSGLANGVETYLNAIDALKRIEQQVDTPDMLPDLILLDINMPLLNGWDFLDRFEDATSRVDKEIRVAILSSSVYQKDREKAGNYNAVIGYVSKPLTKENFSDLMARFHD